MLAQIFSPFDCLLSTWCNFSRKFLINRLISGLKFSFFVKVSQSSFKSRSQDALIWTCKMYFFRKEPSLKNCTLHVYFKIPYKKENFKPEMKSLLENLLKKLHQVESKQSKGTQVRANIRWKLEGEKCSKTFFKISERKMCNTKRFLKFIDRYNDGKYARPSSNPEEILRSATNSLTPS